ncbi:MAG: hypothetical protein HC829_08095 [Bacteroidales bacterium]|nr:hypothetical protein [Bacteroidales bacterium]
MVAGRDDEPCPALHPAQIAEDDDDLRLPIDMPGDIDVIAGDDDDITDSERRRQPELRRVEAPETLAPMTDDFILDKAPEDDTLRASRMTRLMRGVAQQAALDPADNMNL